ncbi:hypothetical protein MMC10_005969 [Thelotrema lepadinum]|nr:hypothetical protein [Thelotrema lepadinum]
MEALSTEVKKLAHAADEHGRKKLLNELRDLAYSIESPDDSVQRIMYQGLQISVVRVGIDLKIFDTLAASGGPSSLEDLVKETGAAPVLLGRILRHLASTAAIVKTKKDEYAANNVTKALAKPGFHFDNMGPAYQALPDFLAETKYQDPTNVVNSPLQKGWKTDLPAFLWVQTRPEGFKHFNQWMMAQREGMPTWLDVFPVKQDCAGMSPERAVFVDVGGGLGHQCMSLRNHFPDLTGRVVLQDIPATLEHVTSLEKVEIVAQDFFQPQAVKGAKLYYFRNIFHDYPDEKCRIIVENTVEAMAKDSLILIDDMVVPDSGVHWQATNLDMQMLCSLAAIERTRSQWYELLESAGLTILKIHTYTISLQDSVIVAVPKATK